MLKLSKKISANITNKTGAISEDENVKFRQHLMTLGLFETDSDSAAGRRSSIDSTATNVQVSDEIFTALQIKSTETGGFLLLSDVFCIVNRVKGIDLISPEDTLKFVKNLTHKHKDFCRLITYESGAMALEFGVSGGDNNLENFWSDCESDGQFEYLRFRS